MGEDLYTTGSHRIDEKAFRELFKKYHTRLCYFATSLLSLSGDAEDIVQEAFVKLWQKKEDFDSLNEVKTFLYISVKNLCLNVHRHDKVVKKHANFVKDDPDQDDLMQHLLETEVLEKLQQALQKLPPRCRSVLHLSYFERMKSKEVAEHLQISINTVKTQKIRGLRLLKRLLDGMALFALTLEYFF